MTIFISKKMYRSVQTNKLYYCTNLGTKIILYTNPSDVSSGYGAAKPTPSAACKNELYELYTS